MQIAIEDLQRLGSVLIGILTWACGEASKA